MKIGIIVAMEKEIRQLKKVFDDDSRYQIMQCGIGKVNAALGAQRMIFDFHPDAIISTGCAGGCGEGLKMKDVVVGSEVVYHDVYCGTAIDNTTIYGQVQGLPPRFKADEYLLRKSKELSVADGQLSIHSGLIATGDWFVDSREKMRSIVELFPDAIAVDMESAAIAQACHLSRIPFISFRIVSDLPLQDSEASQYHNFWDVVADESFHITRSFVESL